MASAFERGRIGAHRPRSSRELASSGVTRAMTSGPSWRRTSRGFFAPATEVELTSTQRILDVVPLVPSGGALAGWTAAYLHGVDALDGLDPFSMQPLPVDICLGSGSGRRNLDHARYSRDRLPEDHRVVRHGLPVTSGLRTAFDGGRWARSLTEAVVFVDQVAHALQLEPSALGNWCAAQPGWWHGIRQLKAVLSLVAAANASP